MRQFKELQDNLFGCLWLLLFWLLVSPPFHPKHLDSGKQEQHEHATIADHTTAARPIVAAHLSGPTINHRSDPLDYSESKETIWPAFTLWANKCLGCSPTGVSCGRTCKAGGSRSRSAGWEYTLQSHPTTSALNRNRHCRRWGSSPWAPAAPSLLTEQRLGVELLSFPFPTSPGVQDHSKKPPQILRDFCLRSKKALGGPPTSFPFPNETSPLLSSTLRSRSCLCSEFLSFTGLLCRIWHWRGGKKKSILQEYIPYENRCLLSSLYFPHPRLYFRGLQWNKHSKQMSLDHCGAFRGSRAALTVTKHSIFLCTMTRRHLNICSEVGTWAVLSLWSETHTYVLSSLGVFLNPS